MSYCIHMKFLRSCYEDQIIIICISNDRSHPLQIESFWHCQIEPSAEAREAVLWHSPTIYKVLIPQMCGVPACIATTMIRMLPLQAFFKRFFLILAKQAQHEISTIHLLVPLAVIDELVAVALFRLIEMYRLCQYQKIPLSAQCMINKNLLCLG